MSLPAPPPRDDATTAPLPGRDWYAWKLAGQTLAGVLGFVGLMFFVAARYADQLKAISAGFVDRFGLPGVFAGIFISDAFTIPIPPQFYILASISRGGSHVPPLIVICVASILAGSVGYRFATGLSSARLLRPLVARTRPKVEKLFERYGYWGVAIGSVTPIPFSILCYMAGLYRMPKRLFAVLLLFRIPRLLFFYAVIRFSL